MCKLPELPEWGAFRLQSLCKPDGAQVGIIGRQVLSAATRNGDLGLIGIKAARDSKRAR